MKFFLTLIYFLETILIFFSWQIYTSLHKWSPWYEASGMQFLTNFLLIIPLLVITGVFLLSLKNKLGIPKINLWIPWLAIFLIGLPTINGSLEQIQINIGICSVSIIFILALFFNIKHIFLFFASK